MKNNVTSIDDTDKTILNCIQSNFPITTRPFLKIARALGIPEGEVITRLNDLKSAGIIRRIGGNFVPEKLGFVSTLCAAKVPEEKIKTFTKVVNSYPGVTHNYIRENPYNVWFTFIAASAEEIHTNLKIISESTGVPDILNLPATCLYKIRAHFTL
jgi:siroheme decarboxylase